MRLEYSEANKAGKLNIAAEVIAAILLGAATVSVILSVVGLKFTPGDFTGSPGSGLIRVWNAFADRIGSTDYIIFPKFGKMAADAPPDKGYGLFIVLLFAALSVISYFIIKGRFRPLLLIPVIPVLIIMVGTGIGPGLFSGAFFAAALLLALSVMNIKGRVKPVFFLVPVLAIALSVAGASAFDYVFHFDRVSPIEKFGDSVSRAVDRARYGDDPLPEGDIAGFTGSDLKEKRGKIDDVIDALDSPAKSSGKDAALSVTMSEPVSMYLRGFVGAQYSESKWSPLTNPDYYDMRDAIYWLNKQGFDGLSEIAIAARLGGYEDEPVSVEVDVKNAGKRIAYTPYELTTDGVSSGGSITYPKEFKNYGGSFLGNKGIFGSSKYSYETAGDYIGEWTDAVGKLYTAEETDEVKDYFRNESNYNVEVYKDYMKLSEDMVLMINREIGNPGDITNNHADYKETIDKIKTYLSENYIYSESFGKAAGNKEVMKEFIKDKRGSDSHFASLAALMFRYFGIPARYVEGYLVTPANIEGVTSGDTISVPRAANHAWPEIYIDGFGWVPIEVTPEYEGIMKEADMERGLENVDYESRQEDNENSTEPEEEEEPEEERSGIRDLIMKIIIGILIAIVSLALLALLALLISRIIKAVKWRKAFGDKDPRKGVRALYQYGNEKEWEFSPEADEVGMRASYSTREVTEGDREGMRKELKAAKERTKQKIKQEKEEAAKARKAEKAEKAAAKAEAAKDVEKAAAADAEKAEEVKAPVNGNDKGDGNNE